MPHRILTAVSACLLGVSVLPARVTRVVVEQRESPAFGGRTFGTGRAIRNSARAFLRRDRPARPAQLHHHGPAVRAAQRARHGGVFGHVRAVQADGHVEIESRPLLQRAQPRARRAGRLRRRPRQPAERMAGRSAARSESADHRGARGRKSDGSPLDRPGDGAADRYPGGHHDRGSGCHALRRAHVSAPAHARYQPGHVSRGALSQCARHSRSQRRLGLRRLQQNGLSRHARRRQAVREGRLRSGFGIHAGVHGAGPAGAGDRLSPPRAT